MRVLFRLLVFFAIVAAIGAGVYYFLLKGEGKKPIEVTPQDIVTGKLFPEGSNLLVYFNIEDTLADPDVQDAYEQLAAQYPEVLPPTLNDLLNQLRVQAGGQLDPADLSEAVLFADLDTFDEEGNSPIFGVIVSGTFSMSDLAPLFQSIPDATVTSSDYKGLTLYKIAFASEKGPQIGVAFLGEGVLVAGTLDAAEDVIDVAVGDAPSLSSGPVYEAYNSLGSRFKVAIDFHKALPAEDIAEMGPPFDEMDAFGFSIDKSGQTVTIKAMLHFANAAAAQNAQTAIGGAIQQALQDIQADPNLLAQAKALLSGMLGKVSASTSDSWLTVQLSITKAEIEGLVDLIQQLQQYLPGGEEEAQKTEYNNILTAVVVMMVDNNLTTIPNPASSATATNNMAAFPDTTSNFSNGGKIFDSFFDVFIFPGDKPGYLLYQHDITADGTQTGLVNYLTFSTSTWYYTIDADGTVHQWSDPAKTQEYTYP